VARRQGIKAAAAGVVILGALLPAPPAQTQTPASVTFARHIAPLVFEYCAQCHQPGGVAPFSLLTYEDVRPRAARIADVTRDRYMPPWKADPASGDFIGVRHLTAAQLDLIQRWVRDGAPEGDPRDLPAPPRPTAGWPLGTPDLIVTMPALTLAAGDGDVFRTFVMPIPVDSVKYVRAVHFRPAAAHVVHHANIRVDRTPASRELDRADPSAGYEGVMATSARFPDGHFLAWTPGQAPTAAPRGLAWRLEPGTDLVVQLHLQPGGLSRQVQAVAGFYFDSEPPSRIPSIVKLSRQDLDIPAGRAAHVVEDSFTLPVDVELQAVQPHAHTRARDVRGVARLPDGSMKTLISIPDWDFRWQHLFRYVAPLALPKGTTVAMRITYDNSAANPRNPTRPPARAQYGWQTNDEMGEIYMQLLTRSERDRDLLERTHERTAIADDIVGYESLIRRQVPNAAALRGELPYLYLSLGQAHEGLGELIAAEQAYRAAVRLAPNAAGARERLGTVLMKRGAVDEAQQYLHLDLNP
jgi:mono/diheme cytochrome c family protein